MKKNSNDVVIEKRNGSKHVYNGNKNSTRNSLVMMKVMKKWRYHAKFPGRKVLNR